MTSDGVIAWFGGDHDNIVNINEYYQFGKKHSVKNLIGRPLTDNPTKRSESPMYRWNYVVFP